jgi:Family of unknown function (DUF5955)
VSNEIRIGGSAYGAIAAGTHANAEQHDVTISHVVGRDQGGGDAVLTALDTLRTLVEQNADRIPEASRVGKDLRSMTDEVKSPDSDWVMIRDAAVRIVGRVGMVGVVLEAANNVRELIEAMVR